MKIYAADDEYIALETLRCCLRRVCPEAELHCFEDALELLEAAGKNRPDVVFLDIHMAGINGLELARRLKSLSPTVNLIFVTGYEQHALDAFRLLASGYVLKPIRDEEIRFQLENLRNPITSAEPTFFAQCFGNFTFFAGGKPVSFSRSKAKELFAYLIDRRGAMVTRREIASVLFEEEDYSRRVQKYLSVIVLHLTEDLKAVGAEALFIRKPDSCGIDRKKLLCDVYEYLDGNPLYPYSGEYMEQYSWGEFFKGQQLVFAD